MAAGKAPIGFALLRDAMRTDADLRRHYFEDLDMLFFTGASLPQDVWQDLAGILRLTCRPECARRLTETARTAKGMLRAMILSDPPSMAEGEVTAKGNLNFRKLLERRVALVERLYFPQSGLKPPTLVGKTFKRAPKALMNH